MLRYSFDWLRPVVHVYAMEGMPFSHTLGGRDPNLVEWHRLVVNYVPTMSLVGFVTIVQLLTLRRVCLGGCPCWQWYAIAAQPCTQYCCDAAARPRAKTVAVASAWLFEPTLARGARR
jgi:hypothetical protein